MDKERGGVDKDVVDLKAGNKTDSAFVAAANDAQTMCGFVWVN